MKRRMSARRVLGPLAIHTIIRFSDWARSPAFVILLSCAALTGRAAWFTAATSAHLRVLKSWERVFGLPATRQSTTVHRNPAGVV
jgi:hypothetical protein